MTIVQSCLWKRVREKLLSQPPAAWSTRELASITGEEFVLVRAILARMRENALLLSHQVTGIVFHAWYSMYEDDYPFAQFWLLGQ